MKRLLATCLSAMAMLLPTAASALFHIFTIDEVYSNADGTIQFVVLKTSTDFQNIWSGGAQISSTDAGGATRTHTFTTDLPSSNTAGKRVLVATQGFASLGIVTPDYIIPSHFIATGAGNVKYVPSGNTLSYQSLPNDGVHSLSTNGVKVNLATNFAGQSGSVQAPPPPATPDLDQHGLTGSWYEPATDGQGFEVEVFPSIGSIQVSWFTFDIVIGGADRQRWYTLSGPVMAGQPTASLTIYQNTGGNFNAPPITNGVSVGTATLSFNTCTSGQLSYSFTDGSGRTGTIPLTRITPNVTCSTTSARPTNADFAFSGNWYNLATSGQGFTVEVNPNNGGSVFMPWYTYAPMGAGAGAAGQRWYTASGSFTAGSRSIVLDIFETTGGVFDTPTLPGAHSVKVGTGTLAFQSCSTGTMSYNFTAGSSSGMSGTIVLTRIGPVPDGCVL